ncbi:MAG: hypothetical protein JW776_13630 [Candidatus Lokiarchaeota archaeon]|nr:hypothetical protein [Candidatus Lokiarchaeota archaeon]
MNNYRKNQVKGMLLFSAIILTIFIGVSFISIAKDPITPDLYNVQSSTDLDVPWEGSGDPQTVRSYVQKTDSESNQVDDFNISTPTSPSAVYSSSMNFTILSDYETVHTFETDSVLDYPRSDENSRQNPGWTTSESTSTDSLIITDGTSTIGSTGFTGLVDTNPNSYLGLNSEFSPPDNMVNITYSANFTNVPGFVKARTIGFRLIMDRIISRAVTATIYLTNIQTGQLDLMKTQTWNDPDLIEEITLTNTRLSYLNANNQVNITIVLSNSFNSFYVLYNDLKVEALIASETAISTTNYVAMEFDVQGIVNVTGFFAWIRTLTPTLPNSELAVKLYRANQTGTRSTVVSTTQLNLEPELLMNSRIIDNYEGDEYAYIPFNADHSPIELNVSNYFVVLSANTSSIYSVVTIPYSDSDGDATNQDPDQRVDHLFLRSSNGNPGTWSKVLVGGGQVDAAPFAINLTRPWLPEEIDMKIDDRAVKSYSLTTGIYAQTSGYRWGLAKWNHIFETEIRDDANNITIPIEFNKSLTLNLVFNVNYTAVVYNIESTITKFSVEFGDNPAWELNYTLNSAIYTGWTLKNFSFVVPVDWSVTELLDENRNSILDDYEESTEGNFVEYWILETENGIYSLYADSPNYVHEMKSYLHYEDHYWPTYGFMQGDNISVSMGILNYTKNSSEIFTGDSTVNLYDPDNALLIPNELVDTTPDDTEAILINGKPVLLTHYQYDFENILNTTEITQMGKYSLVFKWNGGNELGYQIQPIFIMEYGVDIMNIAEDLNKRVDVILSSIQRNLTSASTYNVSVFAINDTTGSSGDGNYHINETLGWEYLDYGFDINLTHILVNESLFNPGEIIKVNLTFESFNLYWDNDLMINAQFVQSTNYDWIVMEQSTSFKLGMVGSGTESNTIELEFTVPTDYKGINAPIRLNPFVLKIQTEINGAKLNDRIVDIVFPFIEKSETEFEGKIMMKSMIHHRPGPIGKIFSAEINRVEELVHSTATYLLQISDSYYVTCSLSEYDTFNSKPIAIFSDVSTVDLIWGSDFKLQGYLMDEFSQNIKNQTISVEVFNGSEWITFNQTDEKELVTEDNGFFTGTFDSNIVSKSTNLKIKLTWMGNTTIFGTSTTLDFAMITYSDSIRIEIVNSTDQVFLKEKQENTLIFKITNIGNSTLKDFAVDFAFPGTTFRIGDISYSSEKQLNPYEFFFIEYYVTIPASYQENEGIIQVQVTCKNHDSNEVVQNSSSFELTVLTSSFLDNLDGFFKTLFFIGLIGLILGSTYFSWNTYKKLQKVPEKEKKEEKRPRRGRYVEVAKLQKQKPEDVVEESEAITPEKEKETADLDDLLKEEGLED